MTILDKILDSKNSGEIEILEKENTMDVSNTIRPIEYAEAKILENKNVAISRGCSAYIRAELFNIPKGEAIAMVDLCILVVEKFSGVRDRRQGYIRIGNVLSRKGMDDLFERKLDDSGYTHIARR